MTILFNYGANSPVRLAERLGHAVEARAAHVDDLARVFRGHSDRWGGGVATLISKAGTRTCGHVAEVSSEDLLALDVRECVPVSYSRETVTVTTDRGPEDAQVYLAKSDEAVLPSPAYLEAVAETVGTHWMREDGLDVVCLDEDAAPDATLRRRP